MTLHPAPAARRTSAYLNDYSGGFGKKVYVERSGNSLRAVPRLAKEFPQARFVRIVRDGRDCAISMREHEPCQSGFRALAEHGLRREAGVLPAPLFLAED
jgi:hypothetical protein